MSLVQRYEQHANSHNFLSLRDRTIAYLESKKQEKKDLGMMAFLTKPKELKNLNDSIKRIADLFNYFSDMAKDFKQNPFMKSIHSDFFYKEQEIKKKNTNKAPKSILRNLKDEENICVNYLQLMKNADLTRINSVIKKKQKNITLKKPKNRHKSLMNRLKNQ